MDQPVRMLKSNQWKGWPSTARLSIDSTIKYFYRPPVYNHNSLSIIPVTRVQKNKELFFMNRIMKQLKTRRKGFSLVELVVVMAIIGVLLAVMAPNYKGFIEKAETIGVKSDAKTLKTMISLVEVGTTISETATVNDVLAMSLTGTEFQNLQNFVADLNEGSQGLKTTTIAQLDDVIKTGVIPVPTP